MKYYDKLIFEISKPGRIGYSLQQSDFGNYSLADLPQSLRRETEAKLPEASELDVVRHIPMSPIKISELKPGSIHWVLVR